MNRLSTFAVMAVLLTVILVSLLLPNATSLALAKAPISSANASAATSAAAPANGVDPALPYPVDGCPYLTVADAAALLQEDVQTQAFSNLLLAPAAGNTYPFASALCGYASQGDQPTAPYLATQVAAARAVVTAELLKGEEIKLMPLLDIVRSSRPNIDPASQRFSEERVVLESLLWGGNVSGVIEYLYALTHDQPTIHTRYISDLGENNIWVWVALKEGHFALLMDDSANVIAALLSQAANEQDALDVASYLALQMQGALPPHAQTPKTGECEFLSHADAMRAINRPLPLAADKGAGLCGYGGMAQKVAEADLIPLEDLPDSIASGVLANDAAKAFLLRFGETLYQENPVKDDAIYATLKAQVATDDFENAIRSLVGLAKQKRWSWTTGANDGSYLFYRMTNEADQLVTYVLVRSDGLLGILIAKLPRHRSVYGALQWLDNDDSDLISKVPSDLLPTPTVTLASTPTPTLPTPTPVLTETSAPPKAGLLEYKAPSCSMITLEEAELIFGRPVIFQDSLSLMFYLFSCIFTPTEPIEGSPDAALITTYGITFSSDSLFDRLQLSTPQQEELDELLLKVVESHDWEPLLQKLLVVSNGLPGWHGERVKSAEADNLLLSQGKYRYWLSIDKTTGLIFEIIGIIPVERDDATLIAALRKVTDNFWQTVPDYGEGEAVTTPSAASPITPVPTPTAPLTPTSTPTVESAAQRIPAPTSARES